MADPPSSDLRPIYRHEQIAADLRAGILQGSYLPGTGLPSRADLAAAYNCATATVARAVRLLAAEGLVETGQGRNCRVLDPADNPMYNLHNELLDALVARRLELELSQGDVAQLMKIGYSQLCLFEARMFPNAELQMYMRYARAIGATLHWQLRVGHHPGGE